MATHGMMGDAHNADPSTVLFSSSSFGMALAWDLQTTHKLTLVSTKLGWTRAVGFSSNLDGSLGSLGL